MRSDRVAFIILWGVFFSIAVGAVIYGLFAATEALVKLAVAVVVAAVGIVTALLNHSLNRLKEQEMEQRRRKEENYKVILAQLGDFIRRPSQHRDKLASANLLSWVVGSPNVVKKTIAFISSGSNGSKSSAQETGSSSSHGSLSAPLLKELLLAMRDDLGLPAGDLKESSIGILFQPVPASEPGHLED